MRQHALALDRYLEVLARRKWLLLVPLAVCLIAAVIAATWMPEESEPRLYESQATVRLALTGNASGANVSLNEAQVIANTANYILQSDSTLEGIIAELNLRTTPRRLRQRIAVRPISGTEFISLYARAETPEQARDIANALAQAWPEKSAEFYNSVNRPELANSFTVFEPAVDGSPLPESDSTAMGLPTKVGLALAIGIVGGLGIMLVSEYTDRTINSVESAAAATLAPILGAIPDLKRPTAYGTKRVGGTSPRRDPRNVEELRILNVRLKQLISAQGLRSVLFTSIYPKEGTTSIACGTAVGLGGDEFDVLLVDGNLQDPSLHKVFNVAEPQPGLTDVLASSASGDNLTVALGKAVQDSERPGLALLTSGSEIPDSWDTLGSSEMRRLIGLYNSRAEDQSEVMLVDGPPLSGSADALALAAVAGGVVLICSEGRVTVDDLQRAVGQLDAVGANVLGIIYNKAKSASVLPLQSPNLRLTMAGAGKEEFLS